MSNWFEKHGTTSDWVGIGVGVLVAIFTILLFYQTQKSTEASIVAAKAAILADSISRDALKITQLQYQSQLQKDVADAVEANKQAIEEQIRYNAQFDIQKKSTQAQINSANAQIKTLQQSQKQFDAVNQPQIQVVSFTRITFDTTSFPFISHLLATTNNQSAKVTSEQAVLTAQKPNIDILCTTKPDSIINFLKGDLTKGQYYVSQNGVELSLAMKHGVTPKIYDSVKTGLLNLYFWGEIKYINLVSGSLRVYRFIYKLILLEKDSSWSFLPIYNFNKEN